MSRAWEAATREVEAAVAAAARELGLDVPLLPGQTLRMRLGELYGALGAAARAVGRIAAEIGAPRSALEQAPPLVAALLAEDGWEPLTALLTVVGAAAAELREALTRFEPATVPSPAATRLVDRALEQR